MDVWEVKNIKLAPLQKDHLVLFIIIIIIIIYSFIVFRIRVSWWFFFFLLEFEWQQVSSSLNDSSQYSGRPQ